MSDSTQPLKLTSDLEPLPYHLAVREYLKTEESELWNWFGKPDTQTKQSEKIRFDLLKTTYRIDREDQKELYERAEKVAGELGMDIPITLYQAQNPDGLNASICNLTDEAHIVFRGPITTALEPEELDALLAHELGHLKLWRNWDKDFLATELILDALTLDPKAQPAHFETSRLYSLYTEVFCDRASLESANSKAVISMLVKVTTNAENVNPASYLKQAKEVLSKGDLGSEGVTHPETFIRALAIDAWASAQSSSQQQTANQSIVEMVSGKPSLTLDLLGQKKMVGLTKRLIDTILAPSWMQTNLTLAHAKAFIHDYTPPASDHKDPELAGLISFDDPELRKYIVYVLLDFVAADRDLEFAPLAMALQIADKIRCKDLLIDIARKELRLRKKQITEVESNRIEIVQKAQQRASKT